MYVCCMKDSWFLEKIGGENPPEDGSVTYKRYIFIKNAGNMKLDSSEFSNNFTAIVLSPYGTYSNACPN